MIAAAMMPSGWLVEPDEQPAAYLLTEGQHPQRIDTTGSVSVRPGWAAISWPAFIETGCHRDHAPNHTGS